MVKSSKSNPYEDINIYVEVNPVNFELKDAWKYSPPKDIL